MDRFKIFYLGELKLIKSQFSDLGLSISDPILGLLFVFQHPSTLECTFRDGPLKK